MKKIDWYIIKKFLGTYFFTTVLILSIAIVLDFQQKTDKFTANEAPTWEIIKYYLNYIPYFANLFSALFVFVACVRGGKVRAPLSNSALKRVAK